MEQTVDNDAWLSKAEAAQALGVSVRQLELKTAQGRIRKETLPKKPNERAARVVYSREDLDAIRAGSPNRHGEAAIVPAATKGRDSVPWGDLIEQLSAIARAVPSPDRQTEQLGAMVTAISQAFSIPAQEREAAATERERAMMASIDRFIELLATRETERTAEDPFAGLAAHLARLAAAFPAAQAKPWLTLDEAAEYSGLPRAWLIAQARAGALRAVNVGQGTKEFWRFNREGLAK
jgi:hypothetical protein